MPRYNPKKVAAKQAHKQKSVVEKKKESTGITKSFTKGQGVDFVKTKRKVGKRIKKSQTNETETKITSKSVNVLEQSVGRFVDDEDGEYRTRRGVSVFELTSRLTHHQGKMRKDALDGILEVLESNPGYFNDGGMKKKNRNSMNSTSTNGIVDASVICDSVCARFVDADADVRQAALKCLKDGILPAFGDEAGVSAFADSIILRCGAALTHVDARVREDAPQALKALIDFAPRVCVTRRPPRETLSRFNAALLDSGEDRAKKGSTGGNIDTKRDVLSKIKSLECCSAFLIAVRDNIGDNSNSRKHRKNNNSKIDTTSKISIEFKNEDDSDHERFLYPRCSVSSHRMMKNTKESTTFDASSEIESSETRIAYRKLRANCLKVWRDCAETLRDEHGVDALRVECMSKALECVRLLTTDLCLQDAQTNDLFEVDFAQEVEKAVLVSRAFPVTAPGGTSHQQKQQQQQTANGGNYNNYNNDKTSSSLAEKVRLCLAKHNVEACKLLIAIAKRQVVSKTFPGIGYTSRMWLAAAIDPPGVVLDGGEVGSKLETPEEWYAELLRMAKDALIVQYATSKSIRQKQDGHLLSSENDYDYQNNRHQDCNQSFHDASFEQLRCALARVWNEVASGNSNNSKSKKSTKEYAAMKRKACVETFSAMIDDSASSERASKKMRMMDASSSSSSSTNAYLEWISIAGRALWTMKHNEPRTTFQLLNAIRRLANTLAQNTQQTVDDDSTNNDNDNDALKNTLQKVESEIAPFFAICKQGIRPIPGPFTKLPRDVQLEALALLGALPNVSVVTIKALAAAALEENVNEEECDDDDDDEERHSEENGITIVGRCVDLATFGFKNKCDLALTISLFVTFLAGRSTSSIKTSINDQNSLMMNEEELARKLARKTRRKICDAIIDLGDDHPFSGVRLASVAITKTIEKRNDDGDIFGAERCALGGVALIDRTIERDSKTNRVIAQSVLDEFAALRNRWANAIIKGH